MNYQFHLNRTLDLVFVLILLNLLCVLVSIDVVPGCLLISLILPFIHPYASRNKLFKFTMLPIIFGIISLFEISTRIWLFFFFFLYYGRDLLVSVVGLLLLLFLLSLVFEGRRRKDFFCSVWVFLKWQCNLQPKQEDKIEPCPCCFDFVMNHQVGSFTLLAL